MNRYRSIFNENVEEYVVEIEGQDHSKRKFKTFKGKSLKDVQKIMGKLSDKWNEEYDKWESMDIDPEEKPEFKSKVIPMMYGGDNLIIKDLKNKKAWLLTGDEWEEQKL